MSQWFEFNCKQYGAMPAFYQEVSAIALGWAEAHPRRTALRAAPELERWLVNIGVQINLAVNTSPASFGPLDPMLRERVCGNREQITFFGALARNKVIKYKQHERD